MAGYLVNRQGPEGYIPSGEPRGMPPEARLASMRGMLPSGDWLRALLAVLMARQAPPASSPFPVRPETLRGINGMLRPRSVPYHEQYPYPQIPSRG